MDPGNSLLVHIESGVGIRRPFRLRAGKIEHTIDWEVPFD
jgi:hypothetical protein